MSNFIFISPNFPENYWHFCDQLRKNGMNVLGIGDCPYDNLTNELRSSLTEYYKVSSLENYDEVYKAVAFFIFKYGRIDWLESNNEYWLEQDARLRTDFNITSGFKTEDMPYVKYKSRMKLRYRKAGIPVARYHIVDDKKNCMAFIRRVGFPVIAKPDNGVGASHTCKINSEEELDAFLASRLPISYIMEECVNGRICSYDAIINSKGEPIFETGNITENSIMDIVNDAMDCAFYMVKDLNPKIRDAGRRAVAAFGVKSRFIHLEFFELSEDQAGLGAKGDIVALEVNMRPSGGYSPEMHNNANSTDVYKLYADMIAYDHSDYPVSADYNCAFVGRRDARSYAYSDEEICEKYRDHICMHGRLADALSSAMGNRIIMAKFRTLEEMNEFFHDSVLPG